MYEQNMGWRMRMNKKRDRYFGNYEETNRDSRVKLYKSGKNGLVHFYHGSLCFV